MSNRDREGALFRSPLCPAPPWAPWTEYPQLGERTLSPWETVRK